MDQKIGIDGEKVVLELKDISKSFPGVQALDHVSLTLREGEVQALLGENGAGKSTLIKIIVGVYRPDHGNYRINGEDAHITNPHQAFLSGINVVHQERGIIPTFTAGENVMIERMVGKGLRLTDREKINNEARQYMDLVGLDISPKENVNILSAAQRQLIEIARALSSQGKILLLDEPTASIAIDEADRLLETIRVLRKQGVSILYVTHKLEEVFKICDIVTVLRDGKNAAPTAKVEDLDWNSVIKLMIGRTQSNEPFPSRISEEQPILEVTNLRGDFSPIPASFNLNRGEILGWYGLVGSGRTELARAIIGADIVRSGSIKVKGKKAQIHSVSEALHHWHIGYVSENRQDEGVFLIHSLTRNITAAVWNRLSTVMGWLDVRAEDSTARQYRDTLGIKSESLKQVVGTLSGGNQQKVSVAKWLASKPEVLIIDEPTVGIDIKTKYEIHQLIRQLALEGISIILISSDMPEMIRLADRILTFRSGRIVGEISNNRDYDSISHQIMKQIVVLGKDRHSNGSVDNRTDSSLSA